MTDEQIVLGRRAVACRGWRWMPGMRWWTDDDHGRLDDFQPEYMGRPTDALPDLSDPATLGCVLALVRQAWAYECACVLPLDYGPGGVWWVCRLAGNGRALTERHWPTEAEALVFALEATP